jgi:hypothetical protein
VFKAVSEEATKLAEAAAKKKGKRKPIVLTADGISLEAFQLSDQANTLFETGVLPSKKISGGTVTVKAGGSTPGKDKSSAFDSYSSKMQSIAARATGTGGKSSGAGGSSNNSNNNKGNSKDATVSNDNIQLNSEILIQNNDVTEVDPVLLAVPLPITQLKTPVAKAPTTAAAAALKKKATSGAAPFISNLPPLPEFEHSFPSENEQAEDAQTARLAKLHFTKILSTMSSPGVKDRMRDPHFLQYLHKLLDKPTREALGRSLVDGSDKFPGLVKVALDMLKMTLGGAGKSDKNSVARRSGGHIQDEDEDDDE